mmetsp:Transcript_51555/g.122631  ORF Transcript_51555/g.122631 Transcript_51555/m.122631 type:complete len:220 (+) Transcript_51555:961-1620(+)
MLAYTTPQKNRGCLHSLHPRSRCPMSFQFLPVVARGSLHQSQSAMLTSQCRIAGTRRRRSPQSQNVFSMPPRRCHCLALQVVSGKASLLGPLLPCSRKLPEASPSSRPLSADPQTRGVLHSVKVLCRCLPWVMVWRALTCAGPSLAQSPCGSWILEDACWVSSSWWARGCPLCHRSSACSPSGSSQPSPLASGVWSRVRLLDHTGSVSSLHALQPSQSC